MTSSAASLIPVNIYLGVLLAVLLLVAAAVAGWCHLDPHPYRSRAREILVAGVRAAVQLAVVSVVITWAVKSVPGVVAFIVVMSAVAVRTAGRRITGNDTWWLTVAPIGAGVIPVVAVLLLTGLVRLKGPRSRSASAAAGPRGPLS